MEELSEDFTLVAAAPPQSLEFKMSSGRFAMEMIYRYAGVSLLLLSACAVAGIVLGITIDFRWLIVGLMVIFLVAPMLLTFLYFYFGLRREAYVNTVSHIVEARENGIALLLNFGEEQGAREEFFNYSEMSPIKTGLKSIRIPLDSPLKGFIWIPVAAYETDEEFICAIKFMDCKIHLAKGLTLPIEV